MLCGRAVGTFANCQLYLTDWLYLHQFCGNVFFGVFYFLPCEPGRALIAFQEMYTRIFKHVSHTWQSSEVIRNP